MTEKIAYHSGKSIVHVTCHTDWYGHRMNKSVQWEGRLGTASALPFDGVAYIVVGRMVFECSAGRPHPRKPTSLVCLSFSASVHLLCVVVVLSDQ